MDFLNFLQQIQGNTDVFSISDVVFTITLSFILCSIIAWVYRATHNGISYSQAYVHTMIMIGMIVSIIMLIIGSNIARAFTLVGALSIIRFRNAVKDTRDVGYIFYTMSIGMACGTRFYLVAIVSTLMMSFFLWALATFNLFAKEIREQILKINLPSDLPYQTLFEPTFNQYLRRVELIAVESVQGGSQTELVYSVELKRPKESHSLLEQIRTLNQNHKVSLVTGLHEVDL